jgi:hypothetical protein
VIVDIAKLRAYCLSETHLRGRHKARVFRSRLGLDASDAGLVRQKLLEAILANADHLTPTDADRYGQRFILDFEMTTAQGSAVIRSAWIVRANEDVLRFVTCFVL